MKLKDEITFELMLSVRKAGHEVVIPNFYFGRYEMDVFRLLPNGNVYEYEIKTSRQDFKTDFTKKRQVIHNGKVVEVTKHEELKFGNYCANKFIFVVPKDLVKPSEVPEKLGLIYYSKDEFGSRFELVKQPKFLTKKQIDVNKDELITKLAFRELNLRLKIYNLTNKKIIL